MQISEHSTAYQLFSQAGYQRLRAALMQQAHLFEWVVTEAQLENSDDWAEVIAHLWAGSMDAVSSQKKSGQPRHSRMTVRNLHQLSSVASPVDLEAHRSELKPSKLKPAVKDVSETVTASSTQYFVLMCSSTLNVLLTATPLDFPESAKYQVGLTFEDAAIARFVTQLGKNSDRPTLDRPPDADQSLTHQAPAYQGHPPTHQTLTQGLHHMSPAHFSKNSDKKSDSALDKQSHPKAAERDKMMVQKDFVLSWVKQLAISPEGEPQGAQSILDKQSVLDKQLEQSLLLNQVITQIRHSLDLPSILETTVAQVREFLGADRLVIYQFEQAEPEASETTEMADPAHRPLGHITYESRISKAISSILNFAEEDCFDLSQTTRARYLTGQPIAINDVEQHYQKIDCLSKLLKQAQVKSKIIAPILVKEQLWGLLVVHQCHRYRQWEKTEIVFLQHIAEHLAVAITQASLYQQVQQQTHQLESCVVERTQNLHDALMAAESANVTKGEFLSTMSHELRTPLTYIIGMSATLLRWSFGELSDRQRSYLKTINHSGEQLLKIINDILEFANIESGRSLLDFSELSLSELVNAIATDHQAQADKQDIQLSCDVKISPNSDTFRADAKRLQQILSNLLHNAIKFTPPNGQVSLQVWRESNAAVFQVKDTGIGIPESQRSALFEKFKQLESPFQRQYSGTGLGLAMTKRLVELHGGSIHVDSHIDKGSIFTVRLPRHSDILPSQNYQVPSTLEENVERVILLETEDDDAAIICEMLTAAGYEVIWLVEADQLAAQLDLLKPVMLIADLALLSHDLEKIKAIQLAITALSAKVLALTGQPDSAPLYNMAHHDILHKPIDPKVLLTKVRQLTVKAL